MSSLFTESYYLAHAEIFDSVLRAAAAAWVERSVHKRVPVATLCNVSTTYHISELGQKLDKLTLDAIVGIVVGLGWRGVVESVHNKGLVALAHGSTIG